MWIRQASTPGFEEKKLKLSSNLADSYLEFEPNC